MLNDETIKELLITFLGDMSYIAKIEIEGTLTENAMESLSSIESKDPKVKMLIQMYQNLLKGVVEPFDTYFGVPEKLSEN